MSYIAHENNRSKLYGKDMPADRLANEGITDKIIYQMNRGKVRNLVFDETTDERLYCPLCKRRRTSITKQQLLATYENNTNLREKVNNERRDGISYAFCTECGDIAIEPKSELMPVHMGAQFQCTNCQFTPENAGKKRSLSPKLMYDDPQDENKILRMGEPTATSNKSWYYYCSICKYRTPILKSELKRKYVDRSFLKSIPTRKKKPEIPLEDYSDLSGLGVPTSLVGERTIV